MNVLKQISLITLVYFLFFILANAAIADHNIHKQHFFNEPQQKQIWNLKNADIRAVIQTISLLTKKNFVIDPRVNGKVSLVSQQPMTTAEMYQVFLSMLQVLNYAAVPTGNVIKIIPAMDAKTNGGPISSRMHPGQGDEVAIRIVTLNHVSAPQLVPVLRPLMQQWGSISAYTPSNSLILVDTANNMRRLVRLIRNMDSNKVNRISVMPLKFANAKALVEVINSLQTADREQGKVSNVSLVADQENNSILVSGNTFNQIMMRSLIKRLDRRSKNGGNTVVIHLNYLQAKKLAPILTKIVHGEESINKGKAKFNSAETITGNPVISIQPEENNNAVIIHAPKNIIQNLRQVIQKLDRRPAEVLVQAIIVKVDANIMNQLGVIWGSVDSSGNATGMGANTLALKITEGFGFIKNGNLAALVHLLMQNGSAEILATPSVVVLNNQAAKIADGKNIGLINRQYSTAGTTTANDVITAPYNTFERRNVTLSLKVTPQISPNNMLRLKIDQKDDQVDRTASSADPNNPVIDTSQINTNVLVRSGDILVLGGLLNNDQEKSTTKIPILGDIPLLGRLFRYNTHEYEKKDLMVFIRPVILDTNHVARRETLKRYNYMRNEQIESLSGRKYSPKNFPYLPNIDRSNLVRIPPPRCTEQHGK